MQERLFFEDINEALREIVQALGGAKKVGPLFWPEKSVEQAHMLLLGCLNPDRKERLTPEQVLLLLRWGHEVDCHGAMHFIGQQAGYEIRPIKPSDELSAVMARAEHLARESRAVAAALERLSQPHLQAVSK